MCECHWSSLVAVILSHLGRGDHSFRMTMSVSLLRCTKHSIVQCSDPRHKILVNYSYHCWVGLARWHKNWMLGGCNLGWWKKIGGVPLAPLLPAPEQTWPKRSWTINQASGLDIFLVHLLHAVGWWCTCSVRDIELRVPSTVVAQDARLKPCMYCSGPGSKTELYMYCSGPGCKTETPQHTCTVVALYKEARWKPYMYSSGWGTKTRLTLTRQCRVMHQAIINKKHLLHTKWQWHKCSTALLPVTL